jgi:hypothetical protein
MSKKFTGVFEDENCISIVAATFDEAAVHLARSYDFKKHGGTRAQYGKTVEFDVFDESGKNKRHYNVRCDWRPVYDIVGCDSHPSESGY